MSQYYRISDYKVCSFMGYLLTLHIALQSTGGIYIPTITHRLSEKLPYHVVVGPKTQLCSFDENYSRVSL